jgi:ribosomal protein S27AE
MNMNSECVQCGDDSDLMVALTTHKVCGKCVRENYLKATRGGK